MSKHPKPGGGKPHPQPQNNNAHNEETSVSSDVHIDDKVSVEPRPKEPNARNPNYEREEAQKRKKWWLEVATFVVVSIYAGLTWWQGCMTRSIVTTSQKTYEETARPYVGLENTRVRTDPQGSSLGVIVDLKNYGGIPAESFQLQTTVTVNGVVAGVQGGTKPEKTRLNPGAVISSESGIVRVQKFNVMDLLKERKMVVDAYYQYSYKWRDKQETICAKEEYDPDFGMFLYRGAECAPTNK